MTLNDIEPPKKGFLVNFSQFLDAAHISTLKMVILPLLAQIVWKPLQIVTDMLLIVTVSSDKLFTGVNVDDLKWPWTPKIGVFGEFFLDFRLHHT